MSLNKVMLIGRLGRDPEVRYLPSGDAVCNFSIATSESWNDKKTGNKVERTEWHNISMFGRLAEIAGQYLKKGSLVYIEGRIESRKYTDRDNIERTAYEIKASEMKMLGSKNDNANNSSGWDDDNGGNYAPTAPRQAAAPQHSSYADYDNTPSAPPAAPQQRKAPVAPAAPVEDMDDDIPF